MENKDYLKITVSNSDIDITEKDSGGWDKLMEEERKRFNEMKTKIIESCCVDKYEDSYYKEIASIKLDYTYSKISDQYRDKLIKLAKEKYNKQDDNTNFILLKNENKISMFLSDCIAYNI